MAYEYCFCIAHVDQVPTNAVERAALVKASQWPVPSIIRIAFLDGPATLRDRVAAAAQEWLTATKARLTFEWIADPAVADVRISFLGRGSWSYVGTDCRKIAKDRPTMNYGWLTDASTDAEVKEVVLHEFGHMLGLVHEHQNPDVQIPWNKPAVYAELFGPPNRWDKHTVDRNLFKPYQDHEINGTDYDPDSIMHYPVPQSWTVGDFEVGANTSLSAADIQLIGEIYG